MAGKKVASREKKDDKKVPRTRSRQKASPKAAAAATAAVNPLKRSFAASAKDGGDAVAEPSKKQQSGFITYLRCCSSGKDELAKNQAEIMLMTPQEKKNLISSFYASGGRKAGLQSIYEQSLSLEQKSDARSWVGYATPTKIMALHEVCSETGVCAIS